MSRPEEAKTFMAAFSNSNARNFVKNIMKKNYAEGVLLHHPRSYELNRAYIYRRVNELVEGIFSDIAAIQRSPQKLFELLSYLSRSNNNQNQRWFDEFLEAYRYYKHNRKLLTRYQQLKPYLKGNSYCDIGCGGGDLAAFMKRHHTGFTHVAGIDTMDWRTEEISNEIDFQMLDFTVPGMKSDKQYDVLTCLAVLHHAGNTDYQTGTFLQNLKTALKEGGRLIIEEDVILPEREVKASSFREQINNLKDKQPFLNQFLSLPVKTQRDVIIIIDFLANSLAVGVPDMPFPCGFRTLSDWEAIFRENGFSIADISIQGFVKGNFNQSSHVLFILTL